MTGTAQTEEKEFRNIYRHGRYRDPDEPSGTAVRIYEDAVYKTKKEKFHAVVEEIAAGP